MGERRTGARAPRTPLPTPSSHTGRGPPRSSNPWLQAFAAFRKNRGGATQLQMHARSVGLDGQGRSEAGQEAQRQRQNDASAVKNAAGTERRAVEATATSEHASLDADQAATALAMVGALRSVAKAVPVTLYDTLSLVRAPSNTDALSLSPVALSHTNLPSPPILSSLNLQSFAGVVRPLQIQSVIYNFTRTAKQSYKEAPRFEALRFDRQTVIQLQGLAMSAADTNQRLQLQVDLSGRSLLLTLSLSANPNPSPNPNTPTPPHRRWPRGCCVSCGLVQRRRRMRRRHRRPSSPTHPPTPTTAPLGPTAVHQMGPKSLAFTILRIPGLAGHHRQPASLRGEAAQAGHSGFERARGAHAGTVSPFASSYLTGVNLPLHT